MPQVLLIRHAEKPTPDDAVQGVDEAGRPDANELSVLGWQRAGALAALLSSQQQLQELGLERPRHLFAPCPTSDAPSARSVRTLQPVADVLQLPISLDFTLDDEPALARAAAALDGCVLIAWQHERLPRLAAALAGAADGLPAEWPTDRYDLIWAFDRTGGGWRFWQVPQMLLAGDKASLIE